jgi:NAD(P)-dependent dehydrogenase (short-subunit alcohol dehydrogenase family)
MVSALHKTGAKKVYILGRRFEVLTSAAESLDQANQIVIPIQCDVSDPASIASAVKLIEKEVGYIDVLINNAGISGPDHRAVHTATSIADIQKTMLSDWSGWGKTFDINASSVIGVSAAFLHLLDHGNARRGFETGKMSFGGRPRQRKIAEGVEGIEGVDRDDVRSSQIITIASVAAYNRFVTAGLAYSASKAGAAALGKALANLLAPWGIRSNVICPGSELNLTGWYQNR